jgi:hypothetical protein
MYSFRIVLSLPSVAARAIDLNQFVDGVMLEGPTSLALNLTGGSCVQIAGTRIEAALLDFYPASIMPLVFGRAPIELPSVASSIWIYYSESEDSHP